MRSKYLSECTRVNNVNTTQRRLNVTLTLHFWNSSGRSLAVLMVSFGVSIFKIFPLFVLHCLSVCVKH